MFLGPPGTGKSHLAQAIGQAAILQGYRVLYRETHHLLEELAEAAIDDTRKQRMEFLTSVPLLILDDLGMRKLPLTAAEDLLEIVMRRYERVSTLLTSNRPVDDWGNCSAMPPPSAPCWIGCFITDTCSSAVRPVGAPKSMHPAPMRMPDESLSKPTREAGQKPPGDFRSLDPGTSAPELHPRIPGKTKTLCAASRFRAYPQRVPHSRFFGASPLASALDLRTRARSRGERLHLIIPAHPQRCETRLAVTSRCGVKQPCPGSTPLAGFQVTLYGRFCSELRSERMKRSPQNLPEFTRRVAFFSPLSPTHLDTF